MNVTVCLVEDNLQLRESMVTFLQDAPGIRCLGAYASAEEALKGIPRLKPAVVLMDIKLPAMSGIQCVEILKDLVPALQIIMFTIYESSDQVFEALVAGACGYLLKSTPPDKLLEAIHDAHKGGSPMSSQIARKVVQYFHRAPIQNDMASLSKREEEVLHHLAQGCLYKEIADRLAISIDTVRKHLNRIYSKLHVHSRTDAVVKYLQKSGRMVL